MHDATLTIKQAAALLGVSDQTLRRWDRRGVLVARRHPINGYRCYSRDEVLAHAADLRGPRAPSAPPPAQPPRELLAHAALVGRARDLDALDALFAQGARLVTVTGTVGVGKTALARCLAARAATWFCDLTTAQGLDDAARALAAALGVALAPAASAEASAAQLGALLAALGDALVVLDNFEQLVACASASVARWLARAPRLRLLVTSRAPLGLPGEVRYALAPLAHDDAVALFDARAALARGGAVAARDDARAAVDRIVTRLEHLPLAIEMAAARASVLPPEELAARLDQSLALLRAPARSHARVRHDSLHAAVGWSWDLLAPHERDALAACAVFEGGFSLEAAEAVLPPPPPPLTVLDTLQSLREHSLLRAFTPPEAPCALRFALYEPVAAFAADALDRGDPARRAVLEARHAEHVLSAGEALRAAHDEASAARLLLELGNARAVHRRALAAGTPRLAAQAALLASATLEYRGAADARLALLASAVDAATRADDRALLVRALCGQSGARAQQGAFPEALADAERARALTRPADPPALRAEPLGRAADVQLNLFRLDDALAHARAALELFRAAGDRHSEARALGIIAQTLRHQHRLAEAGAHLRGALAIYRALGDARFEGIVLGNLGVVASEAGRPVEACHAYEKALALHRRVGNRRSEARMLGNLGAAWAQAGRLDDALARLEQARDALVAVGDALGHGVTLLNLAIVRHERGELDAAAAAARDALEALEQTAGPEHPLGTLARAHLGAVEAARGHLGEARAALALARDRAAASRDPSIPAAVALLASSLELAEARAALARGDVAAARQIAQAVTATLAARAPRHAPDADAASLATQPDVLIAARLVHATLARLALPDEDDARPAASPAPRGAARQRIQIDARGRGFSAPDGRRVDLGRRAALARVLLALARQHAAHPGVALTTHELFAAAWPRDKARADAAANRVWVALAALRGLGLRAWILRREGGYLLDPGVHVQVTDLAPAPHGLATDARRSSGPP